MAHAHLFVYGSLWTGTGHRAVDRLLREHGRNLGEGWIRGRLFDLGRYPGALPAAAGRIHGRLFRLRRPERVLARLDRYERYREQAEQRSEFIRRLTTAWRETDGRPLLAWAYYYNRAPDWHPPIPGGDYRRHLRRRGGSAGRVPRGR
jgi:gamma-glutamylcyclotransferase (GGCT)/AIG2-like uncharacterized protein YtfP